LSRLHRTTWGLLLLGCVLIAAGCGTDHTGEGARKAKPTQVIVQVFGSGDSESPATGIFPIPDDVTRVTLEVRSPDCDAPILYTESAPVNGEESITFNFDLSTYPSSCFRVLAYSDQDGQPSEVYLEGTTSGTFIVGETLNIPVELAAKVTTPPTVTSLPPGTVDATFAVFEGIVNPNGTKTDAYFEWGPDTTYSSTTPKQDIGDGLEDVNFSQLVEGLAPDTTYHYRAVGKAKGNLVYGADQQFTTLPAISGVDVNVIFPEVPPPTAATEPPAHLKSDSVELDATVNPAGSETKVYFEWGFEGSYGSTTAIQAIGSDTKDLKIKVDLSGLTPATLYHYRVMAFNAGGLTVGADQSFLTGPP
jgi:hypothetical protein